MIQVVADGEQSQEYPMDFKTYGTMTKISDSFSSRGHGEVREESRVPRKRSRSKSRSRSPAATRHTVSPCRGRAHRNKPQRRGRKKQTRRSVSLM